VLRDIQPDKDHEPHFQPATTRFLNTQTGEIIDR